MVHGSMSYSVAERVLEIGIPVALGAPLAGILGLVTGLGWKLSWVGVTVGVAPGLGLTRVIARFPFGVTATDPATFAAVGSGLLGIGLLAWKIPARRTARVDPKSALRHP